MSVKAKCPKCGAVMTISPEMFGQTASCPGCGAKIRVPAKPGGAAGPQPGPAPAAPAPAAQPGSPPMPGGPPPLPAQGAAAAGPPAMPQIDPSAGPFVDTGPGAGSVAAQVRGRRRPLSPMIVIGAVAVVGVFGLIGLVLALMMGGGAPDAIRYMPADAQMIVSVDVGGLLDSGLYKRFANEASPVADFREEMMNETGLAPEDIRRMLVGGSGPDNMMGVAELSKSMDVAAFVKKQADKGAQEEKVGEATIHVNGSEGFHFPNDRTFVFGSASKLREILNPQRTAGLSPKMEELVGDLDFGRTVAVAFVIRPGSDLAAEMPMVPGMDQVEAVTLHADVASDVRLNATLHCKDSETAGNLKEMADGMLAMVKQSPDMPDEAREVLDSLSISVLGSRIRASVTISEGLIDQASENLPGTMRF